jgi:hypothetical protein
MTRKLLLLAFIGLGCSDGGEDTDDGFEALDGLIFVQEGYGVGFASYHFDAADDIYIDYSTAPNDWLLDNDAPMPLKKAFVEISYAGARTFAGVADWSDPEGTTIADGDERWEYVMVFDEAYATIESGTMSAYRPNGDLRYVLFFGEDLRYQRAE